MDKKTITAARNLLHTLDAGVLSTISQKLDGYPFGSTVPYCLDANNNPIVLISSIAEHTKNIIENPKCSLLVAPSTDDVQAHARLCVIGLMEQVSAENTEEIAARYYRYFPHAQDYHKAHNFDFYRLSPQTHRYIGGFGAIHWIEDNHFRIENPFFGTAENHIVNHMNEDHMHNLKAYCEKLKAINVHEEDEVRMSGIDAAGFYVYLNKRKIRFTFDEPISSSKQAREALVELAHKCK